MRVLTSTVVVAIIGAAAAIVLLLVLRLIFRRDPRASAIAGAPGAAAGLGVLAVQAAAFPLEHMPLFNWPLIATDYYLAMSNFVNAQSPYAFAWTPAWVYPVGALGVLLPFGGTLASAGGVLALRKHQRVALATASFGAAGLLVYAIASVRAIVYAWGPIPL